MTDPMAKPKHKSGSEPVCWWCGIDIPLNTRYRGEAPELGLPPGSGVIICTPACPKRPDNVIVWTIRNWAQPAID